jgi:hypothetical protein
MQNNSQVNLRLRVQLTGSLNISSPKDTFLLDANRDGKVDLCLTTFLAEGKRQGEESILACAYDFEEQYVGWGEGSRGVEFTTVYSHLRWPNHVATAPSGVRDWWQTLVVTDGFPLPGKVPGEVHLARMDKSGVATVSQATGTSEHDLSRLNSFYSHAEFHDLRGNGRLDLLVGKVQQVVTQTNRLHVLSHVVYRGPWLTHVTTICTGC